VARNDYTVQAVQPCSGEPPEAASDGVVMPCSLALTNFASLVTLPWTPYIHSSIYLPLMYTYIVLFPPELHHSASVLQKPIFMPPDLLNIGPTTADLPIVLNLETPATPGSLSSRQLNPQHLIFQTGF
jgi:hypothetical protein